MFSRSAFADAHLTLDLCLGDRAPFGLIEFFNGMREGEGERAAQYGDGGLAEGVSQIKHVLAFNEDVFYSV
jgi:hypothetical protein